MKIPPLLHLLLLLPVVGSWGCASRAKAIGGTAAVGAPGPVVDKVVAVVLGKPITLSEVEMEVRIERASAGDAPGALGPVLPAHGAELLPLLIDRAAVVRGLRAQYPDTLDPKAAAADVQRIRSGFASDEMWSSFLARIELSEDELRDRRRRALEAETIVTARVAEARVDRATLDEFVRHNPGITSREQAEKQLRAEMAPNIRRVVIDDARKVTSTRVVDPLLPGPITPPALGGTQGVP